MEGAQISLNSVCGAEAKKYLDYGGDAEIT
jgi:hypothetical protein